MMDVDATAAAAATPPMPHSPLPGTPDGIRLTRECKAPRTIVVTPLCPPGMVRPPGADWRVEDYDLHKQLYKGKASLLYAATCRATRTRVALKLYRKARLSELNWAQVEREVRLHSALRHPHIVALYAAFEDADHVYLAQEFAGGGDLYEELKRSGGAMAEPRVAAAIIAPALSAVRYLHFLGVIHRDIKPENILLSAPHLPTVSGGGGGDNSTSATTGACLGAPGLVVKLADFGLSINHRVERPVTRAGTLDYMAPEVLVCPEKARPEDNKEKAVLEYDPTIDVWALGVLAYELVSGRPPFERATRAETCDCIMYRRPSFPAWMSPGLVAYVSTSCAKSARKRPGAADMAHHPWVAGHAAPAPAAVASAAAAPAAMAVDAAPLPTTPSKLGGAVAAAASPGGSTIPAVSLASAASAPAPHGHAHAHGHAAHDAGLSSMLSWAGSSVKSLSRRLLGSSSSAAAGGGGGGAGSSSSPTAAAHRLGTSGGGSNAAGQRSPAMQRHASARAAAAAAAAMAASQQLHAAASAPVNGAASLSATFDAAAAAVAAQQAAAGGGPLAAAAPPPVPRAFAASRGAGLVASPFAAAPPHPAAASAPASPFAATAGAGSPLAAGEGIKAFRAGAGGGHARLAGPSGSAPASPQAAMAAAAAAAAAAQAHALPPTGTMGGVAGGAAGGGARLAAWRRRVASGTAPPGGPGGASSLGGPATSGDLCDTPCRPGVVFPSGRGRGGARTADAVAAARAAATAGGKAPGGGIALVSSASSALDDKAVAAALTRPAAKRSLSHQLAGAGPAMGGGR